MTQTFRTTATRPTADHYAHALLLASTLTGERKRLETLAHYPDAVGVLRRTPLKARPLAYGALVLRFGRAHGRAIAGALDYTGAWPKVAPAHREQAAIIAGWL